MIDTVSTIETPEGIDLTLKLAGAPVRACAFGIDFIIRLILLTGLSFVAGMLGAGGRGFLLLSIFLIEWFYPILFEVYRDGQTPGKSSMNIRVLNDNGTSVSGQASVIRNFLRTADFLPFFYVSGLLSMLFDHKLRRIGDLAGGTVVVYCETKNKRNKLVTQKHEPKICPVPVTGEEKRAIMAFSARSQIISQPRLEELAEILYPIHQKVGEEAVEEIYQYSAAFLGK